MAARRIAGASCGDARGDSGSATRMHATETAAATGPRRRQQRGDGARVLRGEVAAERVDHAGHAAKGARSFGLAATRQVHEMRIVVAQLAHQLRASVRLPTPALAVAGRAWTPRRGACARRPPRAGSARACGPRRAARRRAARRSARCAPSVSVLMLRRCADLVVVGARVGIDGQQLFAQRAQVARAAVMPAGKLGHRRAASARPGRRRWCRNGVAPDERLKEHRAHAVPVGGGARPRVLESLGRHEGQGAQQCCSESLTVARARELALEQHQAALRRDADVIGLEVAVHAPRLVQRGDAAHELAEARCAGAPRTARLAAADARALRVAGWARGRT